MVNLKYLKRLDSNPFLINNYILKKSFQYSNLKAKFIVKTLVFSKKSIIVVNESNIQRLSCNFFGIQNLILIKK